MSMRTRQAQTQLRTSQTWLHLSINNTSLQHNLDWMQGGCKNHLARLLYLHTLITSLQTIRTSKKDSRTRLPSTQAILTSQSQWINFLYIVTVPHRLNCTLQKYLPTPQLDKISSPRNISQHHELDQIVRVLAVQAIPRLTHVQN